MKCTKVLIHDAARPNPSKKLVNEIINKLSNNHAIIPVINTSDATKRYEKNLIFKLFNPLFEMLNILFKFEA